MHWPLLPPSDIHQAGFGRWVHRYSTDHDMRGCKHTIDTPLHQLSTVHLYCGVIAVQDGGVEVALDTDVVACPERIVSGGFATASEARSPTYCIAFAGVARGCGHNVRTFVSNS